MNRIISLIVSSFLLILSTAGAVELGQPKVIESFETTQGWNIIKPAEPTLKLDAVAGIVGKCLQLDYDLTEKKLYVVMSKSLPLDLPPNYKLTFYVKGVSPDNNIEFKLVDAKGNTYWKKWENFRFPTDWKKIEITKADIVFAWGPNAGNDLEKVDKIEIAISSGTGGKGKIYFDDISLTPLPVPPPSKALLKNPSFEKGGSFWKTSGNAKNIELHDWHGHDGKWSYGIGNDEGPQNANGEVFQEVSLSAPLKEKALFVFKAWATSEDNYSGKAFIKLDFYDANQKLLDSCQSSSITGKLDWTKIVLGGEAPVSTAKVVARIMSKDLVTAKGGSFIWLDDADLDQISITASSKLDAASSPVNVMMAGEWHSAKADNQSLTIAFPEPKKFSGLVLDWGTDYASEYEVQTSDDAKKWDLAIKAGKTKDGIDKVYLGEKEAQYIKIVCLKSATKKGFGIKEITMMAQPELLTMKSYYLIKAQQDTKFFPRWSFNQEGYWTIVGVEGDFNEAIIGEDGTIEPDKRGYTVTPFLYVDNKIVTRDDVQVTQSLENTVLPIPSVKWNYNNLEMNIKMFASGKSGESSAYAVYRIENKTDKRSSGKLFLAIRPVQYYPPWQGGTDSFFSITNIGISDNIVSINNKQKVFPLAAPDAFGCMAGSKDFKFPFKVPAPPELDVDITSVLKNGTVPAERSIEDPQGFAASALQYNFDLEPGQSVDIYMAFPLHEKAPALSAAMPKEKVKAEFEKMFQESVAFWSEKANRFSIDIPETNMINMMRAYIGFNLVTKDGPALQPGSRSYDKAWWRDGSIQAYALFKSGLTEEPCDFINYMVSFQYESGETPPIIDNKAADPLWEERPPTNLKEWDSQGEMIWSILQYYYYTKDIKWLKGKWDNVLRNLKFMESLRKQRMTPEYKTDDPDKKRFYGILPQSRSHEGYFFEHSYWDDWWAVKGWKDGKKIAEILGQDKATINWIDKEYNSFIIDLANSIKATAAFKKVNYISGCAELGDMDATSVAAAINYDGEIENVNKYLQPYLDNTYDRYWKEIEPRHKPGSGFHYTPYEARNAPVFIYMGHKDRALDLLRFLVRCSRPINWYQLAEVVNYDLRNPIYIGDMPHCWVGAEYINGVRDLFVYEQDDRLILGAGVDEKWLDRKEGITIKNLSTYFGKLGYTMVKDGTQLKITFSGDTKPKAGYTLKSPFIDKKIKSVKMNGKDWKSFTDTEVKFEKMPVDLIINY